jgi:hypothetical protein
VLTGQLCTSGGGGPSVACWLLAATPALGAAFFLYKSIFGDAMDQMAARVGMEEANTLLKLFGGLFSVGLAFLGVPVLSISGCLGPETGAVALLAGDSSINLEDARRIRRAYVGTTVLSVFWILMNASAFWVNFVFAKVMSSEHNFDATTDNLVGELMGNLVCGHIVFPLSFSGWWCSMRIGSTLARRRVLRVMQAARSADPKDESAWRRLVADALELDTAMGRLSAGWSVGLAAFTCLCGGLFCAMFCMFVNRPYLDAAAASGVEDGHSQEATFESMKLLSSL